jgi:FKBP-type peptidyl-prolyl cis-trans isomerase
MKKTLIFCAVAAMLTGMASCSNKEKTSATAEGEQADSIAAPAVSTAEANKQAGEAFLAKNKKRAEVNTTESGLQYEIINEGQGVSPTASDMVTVHYTGTLIDGTVFDSSVERGEPATFGVNQVIPGWVEALQMMKKGAKWRLYIPSNLAYGEQGAGDVIGPNATLIFDVELLDIVR